METTDTLTLGEKPAMHQFFYPLILYHHKNNEVSQYFYTGIKSLFLLFKFDNKIFVPTNVESPSYIFTNMGSFKSASKVVMGGDSGT